MFVKSISELQAELDVAQDLLVQKDKKIEELENKIKNKDLQLEALESLNEGLLLRCRSYNSEVKDFLEEKYNRKTWI